MHPNRRKRSPDLYLGTISVLVLLVILCSGAPGQAQRLTLEEAISRALEVSDDLHISQEEVRLIEWQSLEAGNRRLPQLDFSGQYLYTSEIMSIEQAPMTIVPGAPLAPITIPGKTTSFGDHHTVDFKLQVTQPLFTGFRLQRTYRAAQQKLRTQQAETRRLEWQVRCQAEEYYIQAQKSQALVDLARRRVDQLQRHLNDVQRQVTEEVAPREAAVRAEYALTQAQSKKTEAENGYRLAQVALRERLKWPPGEEDLLLDSLTFNPAQSRSDDFDFAVQHRWEFASLEAQTQATQERVGIERAAYYPTLSAFGAVDYGRPGIDKIANDWMLYEIAGINLTWTVWDWNTRQHKVEEMRAVQRQLEYARSALESRLRIEIQSAQLGLENACERVQVAQAGSDLARQILAWVDERVQQGVASEKDYQDAQDDYANSQTDFVVALADYRLARVALIRALGSEINP